MSNAIFWFRQDLRLHDNPALIEACRHHHRLMMLYIQDKHQEPALGGASQWWLHQSLTALGESLLVKGQILILKSGDPLAILHSLIQEHHIEHVYWSRQYEPYCIQRDTLIKKTLKAEGVGVHTFNSSLLLEPWEVAPQSAPYFKVFTPFWRQASQKVRVNPILAPETFPERLNVCSESLPDWQLCPQKPNWAADFPNHWQPGEAGAQKKWNQFIENHLHHYSLQRDIPALDATSKLSPHLHFGEMSVRQIWQEAQELILEPHQNASAIEHFLRELGWREFSYHLLYHVPSLPQQNFRPAFDHFPWKINPKHLQLWQQGQTGYPIVDAGMRELWQTGYMHNRVRMIVASFLIKHLMINWQEGEAWFWDTLVDADLANNAASWQWVAGSGADAAPYFRIFNPILQGEKFDPQGTYIKRFIPELRAVPEKWCHQPWLAPKGTLRLSLGKDYPYPIVDHHEARQNALDAYAQIKS